MRVYYLDLEVVVQADDDQNARDIQNDLVALIGEVHDRVLEVRASETPEEDEWEDR